MSKITEICFFEIFTLYVLATRRIHPAATDGGSCVDANPNL